MGIVSTYPAGSSSSLNDSNGSMTLFHSLLSPCGRGDVDLRGQGLMNRATIGDVHQPFPLRLVEFADQLDIAVNVVDPSLCGLALRAVFGVNTRVSQRHSNPLEWPAPAVGVHPHGHRGACAERGEEQIVGCRSGVVANRTWLVGDQLVVSGGD